MTHNSLDIDIILLSDLKENFLMVWNQNYNFIKFDHPNSIK